MGAASGGEAGKGESIDGCKVLDEEFSAGKLRVRRVERFGVDFDGKPKGVFDPRL
jgi:hypothetical protein